MRIWQTWVAAATSYRKSLFLSLSAFTFHKLKKVLIFVKRIAQKDYYLFFFFWMPKKSSVVSCSDQLENKVASKWLVKLTSLQRIRWVNLVTKRKKNLWKENKIWEEGKEMNWKTLWYSAFRICNLLKWLIWKTDWHG